MRKDFVNQVSEALKIERKDLIEKDIILHQLLLDLSKNEFFRTNFLFKGGTCLIKCYLGYFRFSEDIDFTWKDQDKFKNKSQKEARKYLSLVTNGTGAIFEEIAKKRVLDFKCIKSNRDYVELGGSSKTLTFKIWYDSEILGGRSFIKVQINFVEDMRFPPARNVLRSLLDKQIEELKALFPEEYKEYSERIPFDTYDIREILCEKVRSILTRRGIKARDFADVYLISKKFGISPEDMKKDIVAKTLFALNLYAKYKNNFNEKRKLLKTKDVFAWGHEKGLLLEDMDEKDFYAFLGSFLEFLRDISENVMAEAGQEKTSG
ncbi:nucleotidyl transferase AbiEii/AbiGii toxin family protein [archaeon]|nr:MAG: nucleotidyl transferase AbiEii/AbiGii toxin family protein [archaeon]